jgi:hypothetical protein
MKCLVPAFTFFITRTGYMGFAPPLIASDDLIVLFSGLEYPMIVRRAVDDAYRLIGPAWIDGMMEGELWPEDEGSLRIHNMLAWRMFFVLRSGMPRSRRH